MNATEARRLSGQYRKPDDPRLPAVINTIKDATAEGKYYTTLVNVSDLLAYNLKTLGYTVNFDDDTGEVTIKW